VGGIVIDVEEIKRAVSERLNELDRDFVEMKKRGERLTTDFFLSRIASAVEGVVKGFVKRATGEDVSCDKSFWADLLLMKPLKLVVSCPVPGTERKVTVTVDAGFVAGIDSKLGDVAYWVPLREWRVDVITI
jgi:hypothetical protein